MDTAGLIAAALALAIAIAALLSLALGLARARGAAGAAATATAPAPGARGPSPVAPGLGAPVADPSQGGKCALDPTRTTACGGGASCSAALPSCPTFSWMGNTQYAVGRIDTPTGITSKSAAVSGGLDPAGVLAMVNAMRAKVGSPPVQWDDRLACAAAAWLPLSNYDTCAHGAAPGFDYYAQVVGGAVDPSTPPMQVAQNAIETLFFAQEKPLADAARVTPNAQAAQAQGWTLCSFAQIPSDAYGHYCILCSSQARACGFAYGLNRTGSGYTTAHDPVAPLVVGHFA